MTVVNLYELRAKSIDNIQYEHAYSLADLFEVVQVQRNVTDSEWVFLPAPPQNVVPDLAIGQGYFGDVNNAQFTFSGPGVPTSGSKNFGFYIAGSLSAFDPGTIGDPGFQLPPSLGAYTIVFHQTSTTSIHIGGLFGSSGYAPLVDTYFEGDFTHGAPGTGLPITSHEVWGIFTTGADMSNDLLTFATQPRLSIADTTVAYTAFHNAPPGTQADHTAHFKITLSAAASANITVGYRLTDITTDLFPSAGRTGSVTIAAGSREADIAVLLPQDSEPTQVFLATITSVSGGVQVDRGSAIATVEQHNKIDVYISENGRGADGLGGSGSIYWTLDGVKQGATSVAHYDLSLPVPSGDYDVIFRTNASLGNVLEFDQADGSSFFSDRTGVQLHVGNYGANSVGCIVSSQLPGTALGGLMNFLGAVDNLHPDRPDFIGRGGAGGDGNFVLTQTAFERWISGDREQLTNTPSNPGSIIEAFDVESTRWDLPITVHVSGAGADIQPKLQIAASKASLAAGQADVLSIGLSGIGNLGFGDRAVVVKVLEHGGVFDALQGVSNFQRVSLTDATFDVTISKNSNTANFTLRTNPLFSEHVTFTIIGYQENLYIGNALNKSNVVPAGQELLTWNSAQQTAQIDVVGTLPFLLSA